MKPDEQNPWQEVNTQTILQEKGTSITYFGRVGVK